MKFKKSKFNLTPFTNMAAFCLPHNSSLILVIVKKPHGCEKFHRFLEHKQWRGGSEAAGEAARLMAPPPPPPVILLLPFGLGRVSCRRHNMQI